MPAPADGSPAAVYYRRNAGRWRGQLRIAAAPGAGPGGALRRVASALLNGLGLQLETTVDPAGLGASPPVVRHETKVRFGGVVVLETVEWFWLDDDGAGAEIRGHQRSPFLPGVRWAYAASRVWVDPAGDGATYQFTAAGVGWTQRARCDGEAVDLTIQTRGATAALRLERRPP